MAQFNGTVEQLEQSVNTTESTADYIIESGTSDVEQNDVYFGSTWHWQVYKSGYKRCQITVKCKNNLALNESWAGGYKLSAKLEIIPEFPVTFTSTPFVAVNVVSADVGTEYTCIAWSPFGSKRHIQVFGENKTFGHPIFQIVAEGY